MRKVSNEYNGIVYLGKVDYLNNGSRSCPVDIVLCLREYDRGMFSFSAYGEVWNHIHTDCYRCGQCLDEIKKLVGENDLLDEIVRMWKLYHLNDMMAGTARQERELEKAGLSGAFNFDEACEHLKKVGLYVDSLADDEDFRCETNDADRNAYRYGSGWLIKKIPDEDVARILHIIVHS